jgi:hypothetical protein
MAAGDEDYQADNIRLEREDDLAGIHQKRSSEAGDYDNR